MPKIDLHTHSEFSDGTCSPEEVVHAALKTGAGVFALTDHDTTDGVQRARKVCEEHHLLFTPGVEISTREHDHLHFTGYNIDLENASYESLSLSDRVKHLADTWQESLLKLIDDKGYTDIEVYKRANVDRKLFSKIRSNPSYQPKKITAVAFALALKLSLDDTKDFIGRAGYAFSPSSIFDLIIEYFIEREVYDTYTINLALFEHEQPLLGE